MSLPNPGMAFTPFDPLPASDLNDIVENVEALADGTGLVDEAVTGAKLDFAATGAGGIWWEELGRTTLGVAGDTITVSSLPARKYLQVLVFVSDTGGTLNTTMRFNNDSGSNYATTRLHVNTSGTVSGIVSVSATSVQLAQQNTGAERAYKIDIVNVDTLEKSVMTAENDLGTAGAGNAPALRMTMSKWSNTSDQITRIDVLNGGTGDFAIGSEVVVLGHD